MGSPAREMLEETQKEQTLAFAASQREVWFDQQAWPESAHLNIGGGAFLVGKLDLTLFKEALAYLVSETEALRLVPRADGQQRLLPEYVPNLEIIEFSEKENAAEVMRTWWNARMADPFAQDGTPPWRFALLIGNNEFHGLTIQFHHLVMDGWGTSLIMQRWSDIYSALLANEAPTFRKSTPPSYRDFVADSNAYVQSSSFVRDAAYWEQKMGVLPERLFSPKNPTLELRSLPAAHLATYQIPRAAYEEVVKAARQHGVTTFVLFLAAVAIYFSRTQQRDEIIVGIPSLNRNKRYRETPGMFAGVFPVNIAIHADAELGQLLYEINTALREAMRHASYPLSEIGRSLQIIKQGRDGIFDVLLSFEKQNYAVKFGEASLVDSRQLFSGISRYPLGITVCEFHEEQDVELALEGSATFFSDGDMALLGHRLWHIVESMNAAPDLRVSSIDLLPPEERWAVIHGLHKDIANHESPQSFISQFEHQAALRPEATALTWDYGSMDYQTLDRRASALAARLLAAGAGRNLVVALAIPRSAEMMISLLAVVKAGAAFLPMDVDVPIERAKDILSQSEAVAILITDDYADRFSTLNIARIVIDGQIVVNDQGPQERHAPNPEDLAYVLFTSGSTGSPKGVAVTHAALARRLAWLSKAYAVEWHDRSAQATQITFDPALIEALLPLIHGASVALPPPGRLRPESLATFAVTHGVTIMAFVPSTLAAFLDGVRGRRGLRLRVACCGGEVLVRDLANRFIIETGARLFNVYGPTEATIFASAWECHIASSSVALPIGRPVDDTRIYVLDSALRPLPFGEQGEIYIGGTTLAQGYLNRAEETAARFLPDPFQPGGRLYKTGDRGFIGNDENLYFVGRLDRQVKLRGYRIELGEIESAVSAIDGVEIAAAKLVGEGIKRQIYVWLIASPAVDRETVQQSLRKRLPDYMQPARIEIVGSLPMTSSGKIDYAALNPTDELNETIHPVRYPSTDLERQLLQLWESVLETRPLGIDSNFFEVGGDSLAAIGILAGIERITGHKVSLYALTEHPTVARLAEALQFELTTARLMIRLSKQRGSGTPFYLAASGHGDLLRFQNFANALGDSFDVYMLQPPAGSTVTKIEDLAALYADRIEMRASDGIYVAGFSVGGLSALETARALISRGIKIRSVILIDTVYPGKFVGGRRFWNAFGWLARNLHIQDLSMNGRRLEAMFSDPGLRLQVSAMGGYTPAVFSGSTLLVKSTGLAGWERWLFRPWRKRFATNLTESLIQGLHGSLFETPSVEQLADVVKKHLAGTGGATAPTETD